MQIKIVVNKVLRMDKTQEKPILKFWQYFLYDLKAFYLLFTRLSKEGYL